MNRIPGKFAIRSAATKDLLLSLMVEREIGFCEEDRTAYIRIGDSLEPLGGGRLDIPTTTSLLMGFEEDAETYTYDWKSLESLEPIQHNPLKLWSRLAGMGFYAEVAHMDSKGRDISEQLDYASVLIALYDETTYSVIDSAISSGKSVILSIGQHTKFAYLQSKIDSGYVFRSILSEDHTFVDYTVSSDDTWSSNTYDLGEDTPTQGSNKLLTSGGAFTEFAKKANAANLTPGTFTKVAVNEQGVVTEGSQLDGEDIPEHSADKLTSGHLDPNRLRDSSIPAEKLEIRKKLMVDGVTITATETANTIVLHSSSGAVFVNTTDTYATVKSLRDAGREVIFVADGVFYTLVLETSVVYRFACSNRGAVSSDMNVNVSIKIDTWTLTTNGWSHTPVDDWELATIEYVDGLARGDIGSYDSTQDIHRIIAGRPGYDKSVVIHIDRDNSNAGRLIVRFDGTLNSWAVGATELCMVCNARARACLTTDSGGSDTFKQTSGILSGSVAADTSYSHSLVLYASDQIPTTYGVTMEISVSFLKDSVRYYARFDCAIYNVGAQDSKNEVFMGHGDVWQVSQT
jgi:hypothetical protein